MITRLLVLAALIGMSSSCSYKEQLPFKIVQVCLHSPSETKLLSQAMRATAATEGMTYIDNTERARRGLAVTAQSATQAGEAKWVISFLIQRPDGLAASAINLGLTPAEISIGFMSGRDSVAARSFADRFIKRLSRMWPVLPVPNGQAAKKGRCP